ncbi:hypothetical protein [Sporosarcina sp. FA15]|uniref:hypothetical protein n=1 Tax=Sporosarcina sp. FA15 TaxID=3413031 RepID=UPI003F65E64A
MKKFFMGMLAVILLFGMIMPTGVEASENLQEVHFDNKEEYDESVENGLLSELTPVDGEVSPRVAGIPVFIGGILVGYIFDGVLINNTGFSGGQWISISMDAFMCWNKSGVVNREFHIYPSGKTLCSYSLGPLPPKKG